MQAFTPWGLHVCHPGSVSKLRLCIPLLVHSQSYADQYATRCSQSLPGFPQFNGEFIAVPSPLLLLLQEVTCIPSVHVLDATIAPDHAGGFPQVYSIMCFILCFM